MSRSGATNGERGLRILGLVDDARQRSDARVSKNDVRATNGPPNRSALMQALHAKGIATPGVLTARGVLWKMRR
jgi:hypothetical protein